MDYREIEVLKEILSIANDEGFSEWEALTAIVELVEERFAELDVDVSEEQSF